MDTSWLEQASSISQIREEMEKQDQSERPPVTQAKDIYSISTHFFNVGWHFFGLGSRAREGLASQLQAFGLGLGG